MLKRTIAALLWLFAAWTLGGMISVFAGAPYILSPVLGILVALIVWWDPAGWLWSRRPRHSPALRRRLADLERVPDHGAGAAIRRESESANS
jgi:hypothetical protein